MPWELNEYRYVSEWQRRLRETALTPPLGSMEQSAIEVRRREQSILYRLRVKDPLDSHNVVRAETKIINEIAVYNRYSQLL